MKPLETNQYIYSSLLLTCHQGSVLVPLLLVSSVNDISDNFDDCTVKPFADDIKLYTEFSNLGQNILQSQVNFVHIRSITWQMKISCSKCHFSNLGSKPDYSDFQLTIMLSLGYIQIGCVAIFSLRIIACDSRMRQQK